MAFRIVRGGDVFFPSHPVLALVPRAQVLERMVFCPIFARKMGSTATWHRCCLIEGNGLSSELLWRQ
jgi:hypothetical protein